jgi:DNA-binding CsgD family transcriptional regulator
MRPVAEIPLTALEREIVKLLAEGFTTKEVGEKLNLSPTAVEFHKTLLYESLSLQTLAHLVRYAIQNGIVGL